MPETYSIREAADVCRMSYEAMRARVDRGVVAAVKRDGVRHIPRAELERAGLWPGSAQPAVDVDELRAENAQLRDELRELRLLPQRIEREWRARVQAEHDARERAEAASHAALAERTEIELRARQAEAQAQAVLASEREAQREIGRLEERLRRRSPVEAARRLLLLADRRRGRAAGRTTAT
jgi:hypothetical protein